jgi:hypothetical protein
MAASASDFDPFAVPPSANGSGSPASSGPSSQAQAASSGRDARGRFTANNKGGPGNPFARRVAALRQTLLDTVTPEDLQAIVARLIEAARQGDVAAARLVLIYTVGKPAPAVDPDTLDLSEWALWQQMPVSPDVLQNVQTPLQVPLACLLARTLLPLLQGDLSQTLAHHLQQPSSPPAGSTQAPAPTATAASPAPARPAAAPKPRPATREPAARPATNEAAPPRGASPEGAPAAADAPSPPPGNQAELEWLLRLYQHHLHPDPSAPDNPLPQPGDGPPNGRPPGRNGHAADSGH